MVSQLNNFFGTTAAETGVKLWAVWVIDWLYSWVAMWIRWLVSEWIIRLISLMREIFWFSQWMKDSMISSLTHLLNVYLNDWLANLQDDFIFGISKTNQIKSNLIQNMCNDPIQELNERKMRLRHQN